MTDQSNLSLTQKTREALFARYSAISAPVDDEALANDLDFSDPSAAATEATESTSVDAPIAASNRGFQLLKKMGWKEDTPLGSRGVGITAPIQVRAEIVEFAGLGKAEQDEEYIGESVDRTPKHLKADKTEQLLAAETPSVDALRRQAAEEAQKIMQQTFSCAECNKQYKRSTELDTHLKGYEHHHRVRYQFDFIRGLHWSLTVLRFRFLLFHFRSVC